MSHTPAFVYPSAPRIPVEDVYHGTTIQDPYRWLEEDSAETASFVKAQHELTQNYLESYVDRDAIRQSLEKGYNYERTSCLERHGGRYFYYRNSGLQNQSVMYVKEDFDAKERVFIDPNTWSDDGTTALSQTIFTEDGSMVAYSFKENGSDWQSVRFMNVGDQSMLEDKLEWIKFSSFAWTHDNKGIFYSAFEPPATLVQSGEEKSKGTETASNIHQKIYYHVLGEPQSQDRLVWSDSDNPSWMWGVTVTDDGRWLVINVTESCEPQNLVYLADLRVSNGIDQPLQVTKLINQFIDEFYYIANDEEIFYFQTREEVISIDTSKLNESTGESDEAGRKKLIPKTEGLVLESVCPVNQDYLVVTFIQDVKNILRIYRLSTGELINDIALPTIGTIAQISAKREHSELFYKFFSFVHPGTIYRYDFTTLQSTVFYQTKVAGLDPDKFTVEQVFYASKDGTKIPMFIVHPVGLEKNGDNPVLLYGYGGFDISLLPFFSPLRCTFMRGFNAAFAIANIRGGGEYGKEWHKAGTKERKQNVFDDFISAAEYLVKEKYTNSQKLVIEGGSNGGLLVAACVNQRPELFGAVVCHVGVLDMLRFHKFTIGHYWVSDYGCADESEDQFRYLLAYSPYHNIKADAIYPPVAVFTGDHDDRVVPLHSLKFIAELQEIIGKQQSQKNPLLLRVELNAGHGGGKPTKKIIEEETDQYCFIGKSLGLHWQAK